MKVKISKSLAKGVAIAPASKSISHRMIIAAAIARGKSVIEGVSKCDDCTATIGCLRALGAKIEFDGDDLTVIGTDPTLASANGELYCKESGSTLRFLIPVALLSENEAKFTGAEKLLSRPHGIYEELCREKGLFFSQSTDGIMVRGPLKSGDFTLPANVSSQFISGLLFALPLLDGDSRIILTTEIESRSYVELTLAAMREFGVYAEWESERVIFVKGNQAYLAKRTRVEGDWSGTAFLEALNLFGSSVEVVGLNEGSIQGDRVYREHFKALESADAVIDITDCPDLGPILFAVAAAKSGATFTGTKRLRIKESDRAAVMAKELAKFGARVELYDNRVKVYGGNLHSPSETLYGHNDHRIVMSLALLASLYGGVIEGAEAIGKSFGDYFKVIRALGVSVEESED